VSLTTDAFQAIVPPVAAHLGWVRHHAARAVQTLVTEVAAALQLINVEPATEPEALGNVVELLARTFTNFPGYVCRRISAAQAYKTVTNSLYEFGDGGFKRIILVPFLSSFQPLWARLSNRDAFKAVLRSAPTLECPDKPARTAAQRALATALTTSVGGQIFVALRRHLEKNLHLAVHKVGASWMTCVLQPPRQLIFDLAALPLLRADSVLKPSIVKAWLADNRVFVEARDAVGLMQAVVFSYLCFFPPSSFSMSGTLEAT
jgi:hypothetical protein